MWWISPIGHTTSSAGARRVPESERTAENAGLCRYAAASPGEGETSRRSSDFKPATVRRRRGSLSCVMVMDRQRTGRRWRGGPAGNLRLPVCAHWRWTLSLSSRACCAGSTLIMGRSPSLSGRQGNQNREVTHLLVQLQPSAHGWRCAGAMPVRCSDEPCAVDGSANGG